MDLLRHLPRATCHHEGTARQNQVYQRCIEKR
jgi:hypothetical protein